MAGRVRRDETSTPWAPDIELTPPPSSVSSLSDQSAGASPLPDGTGAERRDPLYTSPLDKPRVDQLPHSAPACWSSFALAEPHKREARLTNSMPNINMRLPDHPVQASSPFVLISDAPSHSLKTPLTRGTREPAEPDAVSVVGGHETDLDGGSNPPVPDRLFEGRDTSDDAAGSAWDLPFRVQWIRTNSLPFSRTRHIRNPWNHDRQVKVSRDGTELEPNVGQQLLDEWDIPLDIPPLDLALDSSPGPSRAPRSLRHAVKGPQKNTHHNSFLLSSLHGNSAMHHRPPSTS
jgi:hypothetical protein